MSNIADEKKRDRSLDQKLKLNLDKIINFRAGLSKRPSTTFEEEETNGDKPDRNFFDDVRMSTTSINRTPPHGSNNELTETSQESLEDLDD
jgi:hypothetical protein